MQLLPDLSPEDFARLRDDIAERGVLVPIEVDEDGTVLDGHHRQRIATELGIDCPRVVRSGMAIHEKRLHAVALNLARRHLTEAQKVLVGRRIEPDVAERARHRQEALGRERGGRGDPVGQLSPRVEADRTRDEVAAAVGLGSGKTFDRAKKTVAEIERLAPEVLSAMEDGTVDMAEARKVVQRAKREEIERTPRPAISLAADAPVRHGDFRDVLGDLADGSVDLILTEPPYPKEDLPLYSDLGKIAARLLNDRGILFCWTGQLFLPEVLERLGEHLTYGWTFCLDLPGSGSRIMGRHIIQSWKPVVAFTTGTWPSGEWGDDKLISPALDKGLYEWQQNAEPARRLITRYSRPNALVVDPFCGVGSFGVAARQEGRQFIGVELDAQRAATAAERVTEA